MRRIAATLAVVGALLFSAGSAWADADDGWAAYERGDFTTAFQELLPYAEQGNAKAQYKVGLMYDKGRGVPENDAEAVKWWRKAAEQGDADAQHNLGVMHNEGTGVPKNDVEAVKWFRKAAEQGYKWSQYNLGIMYRNGWGVPQNDAEAVKWYRKAAEQGHAKAQSNLGTMYGNGEGVPANFVKAYMWYSLAKAVGDKDKVASTNLDIIKKQMTPDQIAKAQELATEMWEKINN
jgi:TPR repeat protein